MMKKTITIIASVMAVIMLTAFTDVKKTHWAYSYVETAYSKGIVSGMDDRGEIFSPDTYATKEHIALIIYKTLCTISPEIKELDYTSQCGVFLKDAGVSDWAYKGLAYGYTMGYWQAEDFDGASAREPADRKYIAKWLSAITPHKDFALMTFDYQDFSDIGTVFLPHVDLMSKYGLMNGSEGYFFPNRSMTRAEATTVAVRLYDAIMADSFLTSENPELYLYGVLSINEKDTYLKIDDTIVSIRENSKLLVDGKAGSLSDLTRLNGKKISVSSYLDGDNTMTVIVQSCPYLASGHVTCVESRTSGQYKKNPHQLVTMEVDGVTADFVVNSDTDILEDIKADSHVQFIADGIYLLEIE